MYPMPPKIWTAWSATRQAISVQKSLTVEKAILKIAIPENQKSGSIRMGPGPAAFLYQIAKTVPFHLPSGKGAAQLDFSVGQVHHFPVSPAGAAFNEYFLSDLKGIGPKG
jgi:hypothetical protein